MAVPYKPQPVSAPSGGPMGQRARLENAQKAVPLPAGTPPPAGGAAAAPVTDVPRPDIFGPTQRPDEPLTAGAALGPGSTSLGMLPDDPVEAMRAAYMIAPSPGLARLLERSAGRG